MLLKVVGKFYDAIDENPALPTVLPDVLSYAAKLNSTMSEEQLYQQSLVIEPLRIAAAAE